MKKALYIVGILLCLVSCRVSDSPSGNIGFTAPIYPDYMNVTVPVNIAPLNFSYIHPSKELPVTTFKCGSTTVTIRGRDVKWSPRKWRNLLEQAKDGEITVSSTAVDTVWKIFVSRDSIDYGLTYRLIEPGYSLYSKMGIYERCLGNFDEHPLIENTRFSGCVNCHCFNQCNPGDMSLHIRGAHGATLLRIGGETKAYETKTAGNISACVYPYWHPSGQFIAYSTNQTVQNFHIQGTKPVEVFDKASHVHVYDINRNILLSTPLLQADSFLDTFPTFSPDGNTLFFCRAESFHTMKEVKDIRYNLCRISFNPAAETFGDTVETVFDAASICKSVSFPRPSFDGRFLVFTLSDYGNFSIWHPESDLWIMDLATGEVNCLEGANSTDTESYHNFSSNSRWLVFSSRRDDGLFTRPYFSHISPDGTASKPFMLPQKKPLEFYSRRFLSFNIPEFVTGPVNFSSVDADNLIRSDKRLHFN